MGAVVAVGGSQGEDDVAALWAIVVVAAFGHGVQRQRRWTLSRVLAAAPACQHHQHHDDENHQDKGSWGHAGEQG